MAAILSQILRRKIATSAPRFATAATAGDHSGKFQKTQNSTKNIVLEVGLGDRGYVM